VFPNPANNYITVEYKLPEDVNSANLVITNLQGVVMHTESIPLQEGNKHLSVKTLNPGFYLVQLYLNNTPAASQRVSIIN
jgi:membrane-bound inhibitor of C-type lysozyme